MKRLSILLTIVTVLFVIVSTTSTAHMGQNSKSRAELLETGTFYASEVTVRTGEQWLGLHVGDQGSLILPYRLRVKTTFDDIDHGAGQEVRKEVTVDLPLEPLFLLKGSALTGGPVITVAGGLDHALWRELKAGSPLDLHLADGSYLLEVIGSGDDSECSAVGLPHNARLILKSGEKTQTLYSLGWFCGEDTIWFLIWAGDLDRDGKLDLYINVSQGYGSSEKRLLLSSQATRGQLVKEIAQLVTMDGC